MFEIWFWQRIVSPHMAGLAVALARRGCKVTYVAEQAMTADRAQQGWAVPVMPGVDLVYSGSGSTIAALISKAPANCVHICQGIRSNGRVAEAQRALSARGLQYWVVMETVNDSGWYGIVKRSVYRRFFHPRRKSLQGVLAIGHRTADWVTARGMPADRVYPFAYFLPDDEMPVANSQRKLGPFRFVFAGQLIQRKRVDWLINALAGLTDKTFELWIVGTGPEEPDLRLLAARKLGDRVLWLGQLPLVEVPAVLSQADCLVLPSVHDGWGAVASEALMTGTPVVCSDACGVAGAVHASGAGGVFSVNDLAALTHLLGDQVAQGTVTDKARRQLAAWATCLGATDGADYLLEILRSQTIGQECHPVTPWLKEGKCLCVD